MQSPDQIIMVRPCHFGFDTETAESNAFQQGSGLDPSVVERRAQQEFDNAVLTLRNAKVDVKVFEDRPQVVCPDAIFPNNWFSTHDDGTVILYPMLSTSRRQERRSDIVDFLRSSRRVSQIVDLSDYEGREMYLEGTGSMVFDYQNKTIYACLSPRTNTCLVELVGQKLGYDTIIFRASDKLGRPIYHTNVMMWIGESVAAVCTDAISSHEERRLVIDTLNRTGRKVIPLRHDEVQHFCGNSYEVINAHQERILILSRSAHSAMRRESLEELQRLPQSRIISCNVATIEEVGGGSIRCMMAGNFLPRK